MLVEALRLAILFGLPGTALVVQVRKPPRTLLSLIIYGVSGSVLYNIVVSASLLHFGSFTITRLLLFAAAPAIVAGLRWRHTVASIKRVKISEETLVPALLTAGVVVAILLLTPLWNFLIAPNMDAGNYEVYGNHFWTTGSYYLEQSDLLIRGAEPQWLEAHNTWNIQRASGLGRPAYLPGYPVLLGIFKANFGSALASPGVNAVLAGLSAVLMVSIGLRIVRAPLAVVALTLAVYFTPMLFFYAKQMMSEQLGLTGVLLCVFAILEKRVAGDSNWPASPGAAGLGMFVGISLGLLARLDLFLLVPLLAVGLMLLEADSSSDEAPTSRSFYVWAALGVVVGSSIVSFLGDAGYLRKVRPGFLANILSPNWFLVAFGVVGAGTFLTSMSVRPILRRIPDGVAHMFRTRLLAGIYAVLAVAWCLFMAWAGIVRPHGIGPADAPHDMDNLARLFTVASPVLFGLLLVLTPAIFLLRRRERGLVATFAMGLVVAVYASRHSEFDLWWMRRYIHYLVPLTVLVVTAAVSQLRQKVSGSHQKWLVGVGVALTALVLAQVVTMQPLLAAEINEDVPEMLAELTDLIPDGSLVIVVEGNTLIRGLSNVYRSLNDEIVLFDVSPDDLKRASSLATGDGAVVVVSPSRLEDAAVSALDLEPEPGEGIVQRQWYNWLREIYEEPPSFEEYHYFVYQTAVSAERGQPDSA